MPQDMPAPARTTPPVFELTSFFEGHTRAWGIFEDRFGRVRQRIFIEMHGRWEGAQFILDERFTYGTGETELRTWTVRPGVDGRFEATCPECVGLATGSCEPDRVKMAYDFRLKLQSREIVVTFDDQLHRVDDRRAVNRARMSKWGVRLGELSLLLERV